MEDQVALIARYLERHLPTDNARERAANIVQVLMFWKPGDEPIDNVVRDIAHGFGGGDIPEGTIAEIIGAISLR